MSGAGAAALRGVLYECRDGAGRVILRDRHCNSGEKVVDPARPAAAQAGRAVETPPAAAPEPARKNTR